MSYSNIKLVKVDGTAATFDTVLGEKTIVIDSINNEVYMLLTPALATDSLDSLKNLSALFKFGGEDFRGTYDSLAALKAAVPLGISVEGAFAYIIDPLQPSIPLKEARFAGGVWRTDDFSDLWEGEATTATSLDTFETDTLGASHAVIYVDGTIQNPSTYTLSPTTGELIFTSPLVDGAKIMMIHEGAGAAILTNSSYNTFKGEHPDVATLKSTHPTGNPGDYAIAGNDTGDSVLYVWTDPGTGTYDWFEVNRWVATANSDLDMDIANNFLITNLGDMKPGIAGDLDAVNQRSMNTAIAMSTTFQGTLGNGAAPNGGLYPYGILPVAAPGNKGFHWIVGEDTGMSGVAGATNAANLNGAIIGAGSWIISLGDPAQGTDGYQIIPLDILDKARADSLYAFLPWVGTEAWEIGANVLHNNVLYKAQRAIAVGELAPGTPSMSAVWEELPLGASRIATYFAGVQGDVPGAPGQKEGDFVGLRSPDHTNRLSKIFVRSDDFTTAAVKWIAMVASRVTVKDGAANIPTDPINGDTVYSYTGARLYDVAAYEGTTKKHVELHRSHIKAENANHPTADLAHADVLYEQGVSNTIKAIFVRDGGLWKKFNTGVSSAQGYYYGEGTSKAAANFAPSSAGTFSIHAHLGSHGTPPILLIGETPVQVFTVNYGMALGLYGGGSESFQGPGFISSFSKPSGAANTFIGIYLWPVAASWRNKLSSNISVRGSYTAYKDFTILEMVTTYIFVNGVTVTSTVNAAMSRFVTGSHVQNDMRGKITEVALTPTSGTLYRASVTVNSYI